MIENTDRINQATNTAYSQISKKSRIITAILYVGALIIGALLGYIANDSLKEIFDFVATIFTRLFSFIAVPVIAISLITTLSKLSKGSKGGTIFGYTIFYTLLTTILAATIGAIVFATIAPANVPQELASDGASAVSQYE